MDHVRLRERQNEPFRRTQNDVDEFESIDQRDDHELKEYPRKELL